MSRFAGTLFALTVIAAPLSAQQTWPGRAGLETEKCVAATGNGAEFIGRGARTSGLSTLQGALRFRGSESSVQAFQSDRMYPPYINATNLAEFTFDPASGVERARTLNPDGAPGRDLLIGPASVLAIRDTMIFPVPQAYRFFSVLRPLNPLALLAEWGTVPTSVVARCTFRDVPRIVISRGTEGERLYLEARSGLPVKYERTEPHFLWGQTHAEYVYATWWQAGPVMLPIVAVRYVDGVEEFRRDINLPQGAEPIGKAVSMAEAFPRPLPTPLPDHRATPDGSLTETPVDTVSVGPNTWLLKTPAYTHAVTMVRDTVYLLDATTAEWRSRADSAWIAKLFPGRRATVLVVTDLAWPHVAGVRFWVARGATVVTHRMSKPFLQKLVDRSWSKPDELERARKTVRPRWLLVDSTMTLAGGAIRLTGIDGPSSEGAVMVMVPGAGFLWAGDYVQNASQPSVYAREVMAAAQRAGFQPTVVAAQHLRLTPWTTVTAANP